MQYTKAKFLCAISFGNLNQWLAKKAAIFYKNLHTYAPCFPQLAQTFLNAPDFFPIT